MAETYVLDCLRTVFGRYGGALANSRPDDLAASLIREVVARNPQVDPASIGEVVLGNANGAGEENRNVARMAALLAGLPTSVPATTVNRLCGSSLDAAIMGTRMIRLDETDVVMVGGVESMSRAPWVVPKPTRGFPAGDAQMVSTTLGWRLVNPAMPDEWTVSLGEASEQLRERENIDRRAQDEFALESHRRAHEAWMNGFFDDLVLIPEGVDLEYDESIRPHTSIDALGALRPAFRSDGTITAGNASPLSDGASVVLLGSADVAARAGSGSRIRIAGWGAHALDPQFFGFAPVEAANKALARVGLSWDDIGCVELNEAFASQALACVEAWNVDPLIVNRSGGAIAIGHPLGASGTRLLGTLAKQLTVDGIRWGVAAICIGVGQALAVVLENEGASET